MYNAHCITFSTQSYHDLYYFVGIVYDAINHLIPVFTHLPLIFQLHIIDYNFNIWSLLHYFLPPLKGDQFFFGYFSFIPCRLGLYNTPTVSLQMAKTTPTSALHMMAKLQSWKIAECWVPFTAPRFTLIRNGSTW